MRRGAGFTLIELVVAVAIVGVLAMMAVPLMEITSQRQKETELRLALRQIRTAIDAYRQAVLDKKIEAAADASGYPPDLDSLANGVTDMTRPDGGKLYFLRRLPRDPFHGDDGAPPGNRRFAYYIDVEDIEALYQELKPVLDKMPPADVHGPADKPYNQRELCVLAPDGNLLVFGQSIGG